MKILHTSDWHLGRTLKEYPLLEDQSFRLGQLAGAVREQQVDAVVIAGDLYDRSVPPAQAVSCLDELLYSLTQELKDFHAGKIDERAKTARSASPLAAASFPGRGCLWRGRPPEKSGG